MGRPKSEPACGISLARKSDEKAVWASQHGAKKMRLLGGKKLILILLLCTPVVLTCGLLIGPTSLSPSAIIFGHAGLFDNTGSQDWLILREIRAPRLILTSLVGAVLAMSGAILQGLFRNPLADPSIMGVTSGASAGASISILISAHLGSWLSLNGLSGLSIVATGAFLGGMSAVLLVYRVSTNRFGVTSVSTMLLVGIAVTALAAALNNLMSFLADNELLRRMSLWQMGNLDLANWSRVQICLPMIFFFLLLLRGQAKNLNALLLGESEARHLGVDVVRMKRRIVFLTALGAGVATALSGTIAFVGLIVPHLVRLISGPDHRTLILASGILGAILLVLADLISRLVLAPAELPVGVVTAFLGVPFFVFLLRRQHRGY